MTVIKTPLGRFRLIGILEGISFLALMGIGMPLKYALDLPEPNKWIGWAHGALFMAYVAALISVWGAERWSLRRAALAFGASLVPAGPFLFDAWLRKQEAAPQVSPPAA